MLLSRLGSCEAHQHRPRVRDEGGCGGGNSWQLRRETPPFIGEKNRCGLDESNKSTDGAYRPGRRCRGRGLRGCLLMPCHTFLPSAFFITLLAPSSTPPPPSPHSFFFSFFTRYILEFCCSFPTVSPHPVEYFMGKAFP